jgi:hypothetical protein
MASTFERVVVKDYEVTAENGDHFKLKFGDTVLTSEPLEKNEVLVFGRKFWVRVPMIHFAGERQFT